MGAVKYMYSCMVQLMVIIETTLEEFNNTGLYTSSQTDWEHG